jgi:translation initiation factor eIF-2B subunit gamma
LVYSSDLITDIPPDLLIRTHWAENSSLTAFYYDASSIETPEALKATGEVVGVDDKTMQLIYTAEKEELKLHGNEVAIKHQLLSQFPNIHLYANLRDAHLYIFKRWVLDLIIKNTTISSIKSELVPLLIECQYRKSVRTREEIEKFQISHPPDLFELARSLSISSKKDSKVICTAVIFNTGLNARANNVKNYCEINRAVCKNDPRPVPTTCNINPRSTVIILLKKVGSDSLVGESVSIDERCSIKKSVVGNHVTIGKNCKISNSVVMDYAIIEEK